MDKLFKTIDAIARPASQPTPYSNGYIMAIRQSGRLMNYAKPFSFFSFRRPFENIAFLCIYII